MALTRRFTAEQFDAGPGSWDWLGLDGKVPVFAESRGLVPAADQVYGFVVPPLLSGAIEVETVEVIDFVTALNIAGQIHEQVRDLPPGTPIQIS